MGKLDRKIAVITGGCGNIGYATAKALSNEGARVISIVRNNLENSQKMMDELENTHLGHKAVLADVKNSLSIRKAISELGIEKCDILVNNAGRSYKRDVYKNLTDDIVNDLIDTNIKGTFYVIREFVDLIYKAEEPVIVNISSASSARPGRGNLLYSASKAAIDNMTRCMALNMAPKVRVVSVAPGWLANNCSGAPTRSDEETQAMIPNIPLKKISTVEDVAKTVLAVVSDFKFMTGNIVPVDCGVTI